MPADIFFFESFWFSYSTDIYFSKYTIGGMLIFYTRRHQRAFVGSYAGGYLFEMKTEHHGITNIPAYLGGTEFA